MLIFDKIASAVLSLAWNPFIAVFLCSCIIQETSLFDHCVRGDETYLGKYMHI